MMEVYAVVVGDYTYAYCSNMLLATRLVKEAEHDIPGSKAKIVTVTVLETLKDAGLE